VSDHRGTHRGSNTDPDNDDFVLLHGHYDSWGVGIADNATGDAGLLELASVFNEHSDELQRDLRVAWWPAHSTGRYAGSTWYADEFALDLVEDCVAHVDMGQRARAGTSTSSAGCGNARRRVGAIDQDATGADSRNRPRRAGDYSFNNLGISGAFTLSSNIPENVRDTMRWHTVGGCGGNADAWHLSTDTLKAGKPELVRDIEMYAILVSRLLRSDVLPARPRAKRRTPPGDRRGLRRTGRRRVRLQPDLDALDDLADDVEAFYDAADAGEIEPETANETIKTLSRRLTRLNFVSDGQFEQDPAYNRPPYPRFEHTSLFEVRERQGRAPIPAGRPAASTERRGLRAFQAPRPASELTGSREPPTRRTVRRRARRSSPGPLGPVSPALGRWADRPDLLR